MSIKDIVKGNQVRFLRYRQGVAWHSVPVPNEDGEHMFPVPLSDVGDATLLATDKAIVFMRCIRQALEDGTFVKAG